jgi:hypothetical protein
MNGDLRAKKSGLRRAFAAAVALAAVVALALSGVVGGAGAVKVKQLGKTSNTPNPSCPKTPCEAVGSVSGFQTKADGTKGLFKIRTQGNIVAWAVDMSAPNSDQRNFFGDFYDDRQFGTQPSAGIGIIHNTNGDKYELKRESPAVKLSSDLGTRAVVTLDKPLKANKGDIVALTVPTWLPAFAVGQPQGDVWRASRASNACSGREQIQNGQPQTKVGQVRSYGCKYTTARLLYWAYFVPTSKGGGGGGGGGGGAGGGGGGGGH